MSGGTTASSQRRALALVAAGGAAGTALRMAMGTVLHAPTAHGAFPWATLTANLMATLLLSVLAGRLGRSGHPLLATGALGALSTFSTFAIEVLQLVAAAPAAALTYLAATLVGGLTAARVGLVLGR